MWNLPALLSRTSRGASTLELALAAPLLILLMVGSIEVWRYADVSIKVTNAARAASQYGAQNLASASDTTGIAAAATGDAQGIKGLAVTSSTFCTFADGGADPGCVPATGGADHRIVYVQVSTTATVSSLLNYAGLPKALQSLTVSGFSIERVAE